MSESVLMGYVRKSKNGNALKISINKQTFNKAETYETKDGFEFVQVIVNIKHIEQILSGDKEVTSIGQIQG